MLDKEGKVVVVTEENAAEIARAELRLQEEGKNPDKEIFDIEVDEKKEEDIEVNEDELKERAKAVGLDESASEEDIVAKEKENETKEKTPEELIAANPDDLNEDEKTKREEILQAEEEESKRLLEAKEEELSDEDKEKKNIVLAKLETKKKDELNSRVETYAKEKEISVDDARKTLESASKIMEKYGNDAEQIAIANLGLQHLVAKKDEDIKAAREEASLPKRPQSAKEWEVGIKEKGLLGTDGKVIDWKVVVSSYREKNQEETEDMDDEQVLKIVAKEIHLRSDAHFKEQRIKAKSDADEKRAELVKAIPEQDKQYTDDIVKILKTVPDMIILNKNYSIEPSIRWARGGYFTPDKIAEIEKAAEQKGFERGKASKIVISGPVGRGGKPKGDGVVVWTDAEKLEAIEMFPGVEDEKERFKLWKEVNDSRDKNRKSKKQKNKE